MDYRALATELLLATHPKEKRRPPTETEKFEHVKDGTIRYLFEHDCVATPSQLTDFFDFSPARLTKILGELEAEGMVVRCPDPADRRRISVHLTDMGLLYAAAKREKMLCTLSTVLALLGEEDAQAFVRIIGRLLNELPALHDEKGDCPC